MTEVYTCRVVGACVAAVFTHALLVAGIGLAAWLVWPLSLALSLAYEAYLLFLISRVQRDFLRSLFYTDDGSTPSAPSPSDSTIATSSSSDVGNSGRSLFKFIFPSVDTSNKFPVWTVGLLIILAVLNVGVPGVVVASNIFDCKDISSIFQWQSPSQIDSVWVTNTSQLPNDGVRQWFHQVQELADGESYQSYQARDDEREAAKYRFCVLPESNTSRGEIYFGGSFPNELTAFLQVKEANSEPRTVPGNYNYPTWLTKVNNDTCCFLLRYRQTYPGSYDLCCGNARQGFASLRLLPSARYSSFFAVDGILWFRLLDTNIPDMAGIAIGSVDPRQLVVEMHSELVEDADSELVGKTVHHSSKGPCYPSTIAMFTMLLTGSLPVILLSLWLWCSRHVPATSITLYLGMCFSAGILYSIFLPYSDPFNAFFMWYFLGTPVWAFFALVKVVLHPSSETTRAWIWSLHYVCMVALLSTFVYLGVTLIRFFTWNLFGWIDWVWVNGTFVVLPTAASALLTESRFVLVAAFVGLGSDVAVYTLVGLDLESNLILRLFMIVAEIGVVAVMYKWTIRHAEILRYYLRLYLTRCLRWAFVPPNDQADVELTSLHPRET